MNENEIIKYALKEKLLADVKFYNSLPDHRFSHRFTRKMRKLLKGNIHSEVKSILKLYVISESAVFKSSIYL